MRVGDVMSTRVVTVRPDEMVQLAIARMMEEGIGAVAVCEGARLVGIFTERDVLRLASEGSTFDDTKIGDVMTSRVVTASPDVHILDAARLMGERRVRHLPVVEGENLLGLVGIRDVLGTVVERLWSSHDADAHETARELLRPSK
jgi:CBS domain-containing protein